MKAILESTVEGELGDPLNFPDMDITGCRESTVAWVNTSSPIRDNVTPPPSHPGYTPEDGHSSRDRHTPSDGNTPKERITAVKERTSTESPETTVDHVNTHGGSIRTDVSGVRNGLPQPSMHLANIHLLDS